MVTGYRHTKLMAIALIKHLEETRTKMSARSVGKDMSLLVGITTIEGFRINDGM